jgi:class 3 adenylate cyclase
MMSAVEAPFVTILVTDLVGSTALFARHGDDAAEALRRTHLDALRAAVDEHGGREVSPAGDGLTATFASAVTALRCAVAMQEATTGTEDRLALRVGVDAGEPVGAGEDVYGTPVIVARRLCEMAEPGEILASDVVCRVAGPRLGHEMSTLGALRLRDIEERVPASRVLWRAADTARADVGTVVAKPITAVIVDDERLLRTGFRVILEAEPDITVVGEAEDGRVALDVVRRRRPDVVLMDIRMPELDGLRALPGRARARGGRGRARGSAVR